MAQKKFIVKFAIILFLTTVLTGGAICKASLKTYISTPATAAAIIADDSTETVPNFIQGVWISLFDYENAGLYNKSKSKFTSNTDTYFKKLKKDGINTIYFHVVPCNDAIYPSEYVNYHEAKDFVASCFYDFVTYHLHRRKFGDFLPYNDLYCTFVPCIFYMLEESLVFA